MITRFDKLQTELPHPDNPSPNSAAAVQELLGGKFGEMSTFMNYTFQSFNFRGRREMRPFYDLIANIATEEYGHIELVSYAINLLLTGTTDRGDDPAAAPLAFAALICRQVRTCGCNLGQPAREMATNALVQQRRALDHVEPAERLWNVAKRRDRVALRNDCDLCGR